MARDRGRPGRPHVPPARPRTEGSPRAPRLLLDQRLAPVEPIKGPKERAHAWILDPAPTPPSSAPAASASPSPPRAKLEPLKGARRFRCRSQDLTGDPSDSPLKGRLQRALEKRRASQDVPSSARKATVRDHKRKATTQIDLIEGRPVTKSELEKWDAAFARYQLDGEIHIDELKGALVMCGFCDARPTVVQKVLKGLTNFNSLNKAEFYLFVCRFEAGLHETYEFEFNLLDTCGRGTIDVLQLEQLLRRIGQPVRRFVLKELVQEVNDDNEGRVDLSGFRKIQHLIRKREGFTCYELDHFYRVFQRFDRDSSDTMSCTEFANALTWLGFPYGPDKLQEFHRQNDVDGDGQLGEGEFISCLRRVTGKRTRHSRGVDGTATGYMSNPWVEGSGSLWRGQSCDPMKSVSPQRAARKIMMHLITISKYLKITISIRETSSLRDTPCTKSVFHSNLLNGPSDIMPFRVGCNGGDTTGDED